MKDTQRVFVVRPLQNDRIFSTHPTALEHIDQISCPIIFFQGDEDKVVPPNQSELMHASLKKKGIPTKYHLYEKE